MATRARFSPRTVGGSLMGALVFFVSIGPSGIRENLGDWLRTIAVVDLTSGLTWRWVAGVLGLGLMMWGVFRPSPRHLVRLGFLRREHPARVVDVEEYEEPPDLWYERNHLEDLLEEAEKLLVWIRPLIARDSIDIKSTLHQEVGVLQHGNVAFNLEDGHEPSVVITFPYINASIFTIIFENLEGPLQVEGEMVAGGWKFERLEAPHNHEFLLKLRWIVSTEISKNTLLSRVKSRKSVHVNLDAVRLQISAKEDPNLTAEIRFPQQWWISREGQQLETTQPVLDKEGPQS